MRRIARTLALAVALALGLAAPLAAGPEDAILQAIHAAEGSPEPVLAFFKAFSASPDFDMTGAQVRAAARSTGAEITGTIAEVLANVTAFKKHGDQLEIDNARKATTPIIVDGAMQGAVTLAPVVKIRMRQDGGAVVLDKIEGVKLSEKPDSMKADLRRVRFERDAVKVTAGVAFFSKTVTIPLGVPPPAPAAPTPGLATSVPR